MTTHEPDNQTEPTEPQPTSGRFLGYPDAQLAQSWDLKDIAHHLKQSVRTVGPLMHAPGAPPPLRSLGDRCHRWNAYRALAWLNHAPDPALPDLRSPSSPIAVAGTNPDGASAAPEDAPTRRAPGSPWRPAPPRTPARNSRTAR